MKTPSSANGSEFGPSSQTRELPFGYVYLTTNLLNGKMYVGKNAKSRGVFNPRYKGSGTYLRRSLEKNGSEFFSVRPLRFAFNKTELSFLERYAIALYRQRYGRDNLYNITDGGDGASGNIHSEETKARIREAATGRKLTQEAKDKMKMFSHGNTPWNFGKTMPEGQKARSNIYGR